jgi:glycosyltransferase involved in cell wall biosynthesis
MDLVPLYRALALIRPHVIYQRVGGGYTGICALFSRRHGAKLIWHVSHDTDVSYETLDGGRNFLRRRLEKWSIEFGLRRADRIVVQTRHQSELLRRCYGRAADQIVPNFDAAATQTVDKSGAPLILWVANLKPWKRPDAFIRLAAALQDVAETRFIMVGQRDTSPKRAAWQDAMMREIAALPNLEYMGSRSQDEVYELMARSCIFVNTSIHEGFPNTFIQAWMRDAVVVSLDVDPDGVLEREDIGIHAGSEAALQRAVKQLLAEPALRTAYAERAQRYVRSHHSLQNIGRLITMIEQAAGPASA